MLTVLMFYTFILVESNKNNIFKKKMVMWRKRCCTFIRHACSFWFLILEVQLFTFWARIFFFPVISAAIIENGIKESICTCTCSLQMTPGATLWIPLNKIRSGTWEHRSEAATPADAGRKDWTGFDLTLDFQTYNS